MADACAELAAATSALRRETGRLRAELEFRSAILPETPAMTVLERALTGLEKSNREIARHLRTIVIAFVSLAAITAFTAGVFVEAETGIVSSTARTMPLDEVRPIFETPQDEQRQGQHAAGSWSEALDFNLAIEEPRPAPSGSALDPDQALSPTQEEAVRGRDEQEREEAAATGDSHVPVVGGEATEPAPPYSSLPAEIIAHPPVMDPPPPPAHLASLEHRMTATLHRALWWQAAGIVAAIAALAGIAIALARLRDWLFPLPKRPDVT